MKRQLLPSELIRLRTIELLTRQRRLDKELAAYLGVSRTEISLILSGERKMPTDRLRRLADFFGMSIPQFFDVKEEDLVRDWSRRRDRRSFRGRQPG